MVLRDQFAQDSPAVRAFFDALVGLLTGGSSSDPTAQHPPYRRSSHILVIKFSHSLTSHIATARPTAQHKTQASRPIEKGRGNGRYA